jgi:hypothetical protein
MLPEGLAAYNARAAKGLAAYNARAALGLAAYNERYIARAARGLAAYNERYIARAARGLAAYNARAARGLAAYIGSLHWGCCQGTGRTNRETSRLAFLSAFAKLRGRNLGRIFRATKDWKRCCKRRPLTINH